MDRIEDVIESACGDQRADLKLFAETGDEDALSRIHFDGCVACDRAVEKIIELRDGLPPAPMTLPVAKAAVPHDPFAIKATLAVLFAFSIAVSGFLVYLAVDALFSDAPMRTEIERLDARIVFARLPGRPDVCVASVRGVGGYGPQFLGAVPCAQVHGRVESDEDLAWHLRDVVTIRMRGTDICLAHAADDAGDFTIPCGPDD